MLKIIYNTPGVANLYMRTLYLTLFLSGVILFIIGSRFYVYASALFSLILVLA